MKTLLICLLLPLSSLSLFSQKIIYLDSREKFDSYQSQKPMLKLDEEIKKGIWKNNGVFQKRLVLAIKKEKDLGAFENDASLYYSVYFNKNNQVDSLNYYFGKYTQKLEDGKTGFKFELIELKSALLKSTLEKVFRELFKNTTFYFKPMSSYEMFGGIRMNQYLSKSQDSEFKLAELLKSKADTLKKLNLSSLGLKKMPRSIYNYKNLEELDLSKNEFEVFRLNPKKLPKLKRIILSDNLLSKNSINIKRNKHVQMINLSENDFASFPKRIHKSRSLKDLHLASNFIRTTDDIKFKKLKSLELLNFYNNQIVSLSEEVGLLQNLQILDLYHNQLNFMPRSIAKLNNLQTLAVSNNNLWELPNTLKELQSLKVLYAHHNKLSSIGYLPPNIENLDVGFNLLESVPDALKNADKLSDLDISNNKIKSGAETLKQITNLKKVFLALNDFESDPAKFAELQQIIVDLEKKSVTVK